MNFMTLAVDLLTMVLPQHFIETTILNTFLVHVLLFLPLAQLYNKLVATVTIFF